MKTLSLAITLLPLALTLGCKGERDDGGDGETEADRVGVAWDCTRDDDCPEVEILGAGGNGGPATVQLKCLTQFKGGYCAIEDCASALDCPEGATCVAHDDGTNYCFRECQNKPECNANRSADNEANCSSSFDYAEPADATSAKACIPPSSGL